MAEAPQKTSGWNGPERRAPGRLSDEERARQLMAKYKAGGPESQAARDSLVLQFRPLVQKIARQFLSPSVPFEDLVQEGFLGLMHGIDQYDPTRGVKLITYATHHIDGHLRHFLRDRVQIIREPAWLQETALKVRREFDSLTQTLGREPSDSEVAAALGLAESEVARIFNTRALFSVASLDQAQEEGSAAAHVSDSNLEAASSRLPVEDRVVLEHLLARLKEVEQKVVFSFYYEDRNQTDIARALGVSNNYVSHILKNSARKLERMIRSDAVREAALQHERRRRRLAAQGPWAEIDDAPPTIMDALTGLFTPDYFLARLDEELSRARRHDLEVSVVRVSVGDDLPEAALFVRIAQTVKSCMRVSDIVARAAEHEIAALLPHTGAGRETVCGRLIARLAELQSALPHSCTLAVGSASYPAHSQRQRLLDAAAPLQRVG